MINLNVLKVFKMESYRQKTLNKYESNDKWSVSLLLYLGKSNSIISHFYLCGAQTDIVLEAKNTIYQTSLQNCTLRGNMFIGMFTITILFVSIVFFALNQVLLSYIICLSCKYLS